MTVLLLNAWSLMAHSPNETYSTLQINDGLLEVSIELPWTITDAVKSTFSEIDELTRNNIDFQSYLKEYIAQNFLVFKGENEVNHFEIELIEGSHTHSAVCQIVFPINSLENLTIQNTILFNTRGKQRNYNVVKTMSKDTLQYVCTVGSPTFKIQFLNHENVKMQSIFIASMGVLILSFLFALIRKQFYTSRES